MVTLINPYHLTKGERMSRSRRHVRHNKISRPRVDITRSGIFATMHSKTFKHGKRLNPFRRHRRHARHNPLRAMRIKNWINKEKLMYLGGLSGGFVGGAVLGLPLVDMLMKQTIDKSGANRKFYGIGNVVLGIVLFAFLKNRLMRTASTGFVVSGIYDLIAANTMTTLGLPIIPTGNPLMAKLLPPSVTPTTPAPGTTGMDYLPMSAPTMIAMDYQGLGADSFYSECLQ